MTEFEPGDRSVGDLWTAFVEWLSAQGDVSGVQTTLETDRKFAGTFDVRDRVVLLTWVSIPRTATTREREVVDLSDRSPYLTERELAAEYDRGLGIVDRWEEEP